jgi:serine/threonine protein kinase
VGAYLRCVECHAETAAAPCSACDQEPRVDGRYALHNPVGGGSSGVVFRGTDLQTGDVVAVKEVMLGGLDNDKARQLATREARVLRELAHPGIPGWRDARTVGIGRSAALYLVQDFVDGQDLQAGLRTKRWSEREVLVLMVEVLDILHYLHTRHPPVVHRDIKPANLVRRTDGQLVLVDFGAVRDALRTARTGGSTVAGTFGYMAPEQFVGHAEPTTDLYALGMTAVALLSREEPAQLHDRAGRLDWEKVVSLSEGTTFLLRALLQPDPTQRPRSATVVRAHIEQMVAADEDARSDADIGPTLVPAPAPLFDEPTGVHAQLLDEPTSPHHQHALAEPLPPSTAMSKTESDDSPKALVGVVAAGLGVVFSLGLMAVVLAYYLMAS